MAAAKNDTFERRYIGIIPAPCGGNVLLAGNFIIGGVKLKPTFARRKINIV